MAGENGEDVFKFLEEELEAFEKLYQELFGKNFFIYLFSFHISYFNVRYIFW